MTDWKATTKNGTEWIYIDGIVKICPRTGIPYAFKAWEFKVLDRTVLKGNDPEAFWEHLRGIPAAEIPIVGLSIYASGMRDWRLSTEVVSLEILTEEL